MSKIVNFIKVIWKNDRYRSLSILGIYLAFFLIIIIFAKITPSKQVSKGEPMISKIDIKDEYEFEVSVKDSIIKGTYNYSYIKFDYNNIEYEYSNDILLPNKFDYSEIISFMDKSYVYDLIKDKAIYSTTKFSDDRVAKTYLINDIYVTIYDDELNEIEVKINDLTYKIIYK